MSTYNIIYDDEGLVATGLSFGETCQWLLDCCDFDNDYCRIVWLGDNDQNVQYFYSFDEIEDWLYSLESVAGSYSINHENYRVFKDNS